MEYAIKNLYTHFEKVAFYTMSAALFTVTGMMFMQYYAFKEETEKLCAIKEEYDHYILMMKKNIKESSCSYSSTDDEVEEKKSEEQVASEESFLVVNRDQKYLQDSYKEFLKENDDEFQFVSAEDEKQLKTLRNQLAGRAQKSLMKSYVKGSSGSIQALKKFIKKSPNRDFVFHWPLNLKDFWISSLFGPRKNPNGSLGFHYGVDMAALKGTLVKAAASGTVVQAQYVPGYGNNILIQHSKDYRTRYAHLNSIDVTLNQKVAIGQKIGTVGDTGCVRKNGHDASHLHFEVYRAGRHVNPLRYLFT